MKHCATCGNPVSDGARYCDRCGATVEPSPTSCPRCGTPCQPQDIHCSNCGYPLQNPGNYYYGPYSQPGYRTRSRFLAGILAILLGALGVHNFYLGFTQRGVIQLLLSTVGVIFTCGLSALVAEIWAIVEAILLFTNNTNVDGRGVPLQD